MKKVITIIAVVLMSVCAFAETESTTTIERGQYVEVIKSLKQSGYQFRSAKVLTFVKGNAVVTFHFNAVEDLKNGVMNGEKVVIKTYKNGNKRGK